METIYCFSGLVKCAGTMCVVAGEQTTTSVASGVLFVKEVDSQVMGPKRTRDVREFLKHCNQNNTPFNLPQGFSDWLLFIAFWCVMRV